ncbi:MAG: HNH endonuclease, partial [Ornithinibacter sp.]
PAAWARAHHVQHWADGGLSDLDNAALLCQRHHTLVHTRRLIAHVRAKPDHLGRHVVWDLTQGSYDRHLERQRAERAANDPPPLTPERLAELVAIASRKISEEHPETAAAEREWAPHQLREHDDLGFEEAWHDEAFTPEILEEHERATRLHLAS